MPVADEKNKIYTKKTVFQKAKSPEIPEYNNALKTASADAFPKKEIKTTSKPANAINKKSTGKNAASGPNGAQKNSTQIIIENDIILLKRKMHREIFQRRLERKLFTIIEEREEMVEEI